MPPKHIPIECESIGKDLAKMMDLKRRLIEIGNRCEDPQFVVGMLEEFRNYVRSIRQGLETLLRERTLVDMTPEQAQQAIYACQILEDSLQAEPELEH